MGYGYSFQNKGTANVSLSGHYFGSKHSYAERSNFLRGDCKSRMNLNHTDSKDPNQGVPVHKR